MLTYVSIIITAIFINNIVFAQFLGICPFLGVSKKISSALGMGAAVTFVITLATTVAWLLQVYPGWGWLISFCPHILSVPVPWN